MCTMITFLGWHLNMQLSAGGRGTFNAALQVPRALPAPWEKKK